VRLEQAAEMLSDRARLRVLWKPFEIHPEVPPGGMPLSALPYTAGEISAMIDNLRRQAAAEGLDFSGLGGERGLVNTHRALLAGCYAQEEEPERFDVFHHALFHAHFTEGRNINDDGVLKGLANSSGLDAARMTAALDAGTFEEVLRETTAEAARTTVTAVPAFSLGGRHLIVGAQPAAVLVKAIERILSAKNAGPSTFTVSP
jgi:predicted DsbA family dithiol-disulfide isomerase